MHGIDAEPVTPKSLVKSINSCKSFEPTSEPADVSRWLSVLAAELAERMAEDELEHNRRARTLGETHLHCAACLCLAPKTCQHVTHHMRHARIGQCGAIHMCSARSF